MYNSFSKKGYGWFEKEGVPVACLKRNNKVIIFDKYPGWKISDFDSSTSLFAITSPVNYQKGNGKIHLKVLSLDGKEIAEYKNDYVVQARFFGKGRFLLLDAAKKKLQRLELAGMTVHQINSNSDLIYSVKDGAEGLICPSKDRQGTIYHFDKDGNSQEINIKGLNYITRVLPVSDMQDIIVLDKEGELARWSENKLVWKCKLPPDKTYTNPWFYPVFLYKEHYVLYNYSDNDYKNPTIYFIFISLINGEIVEEKTLSARTCGGAIQDQVSSGLFLSFGDKTINMETMDIQDFEYPNTDHK